MGAGTVCRFSGVDWGWQERREEGGDGVFEASVDTQCTLWECHQLRIYLAT